MTYCMRCTSECGPFTTEFEDGRAVVTCAACLEPAFERRGPERGYEPNGGLPTYEEGRAACARLAEDPRWRRCADLDEEHSRTPFASIGAVHADRPTKAQLNAPVRRRSNRR